MIYIPKVWCWAKVNQETKYKNQVWTLKMRSYQVLNKILNLKIINNI